MRSNLSCLLFAVLCLLQCRAAAPRNVAGVEGSKNGFSVPSSRLRQTTWPDIQARQERRKSPFYKRQIASAKVYPTCAGPASDVPIARYPATEIFGGDSITTTWPIDVVDESACVQVCSAAAGCVAYFYRPSKKSCYPKFSWDASALRTTSRAAQSTGAVSGILGTCAEAAVNGVPSSIGNACCDSAATVPRDPKPRLYLTCSATASDVAVARYMATEIRNGDSANRPGVVRVMNEAACLSVCRETSDCIGYFYRADENACYPKMSWSQKGFYSTSRLARSDGAVAGLIGSCQDAAAQGVPGNYDKLCCDSAPVAPIIKQCPVTADWAKVARVVNADLPGFGTLNSTASTEDQCIQQCMDRVRCMAYTYVPTTKYCELKVSGWPATIITTTSPEALAGTITGLKNQTCSEQQNALTAGAYANCCDY